MPLPLSGLIRRHLCWVLALIFFVLSLWFTAGQEPEHNQQAFVAALLLCTTGVFVFAFGRVAFALVLGGGLFLLLRAITVLKQEYLESPLMPADFIYYVRSSLFVTLSRYPHLYSMGIALIVLVPPLLWLVWRYDLRLFSTFPRARQRLLRAGGVLFAAALFWICMLPSGPFAAVHNRGVWEKMSDDAELSDFFVNFDDSSVSLPPMSDDAAAQRDWQATSAGTPGSAKPPYPDVIEVLEESTFDPADFDACTVPACHPAMLGTDAMTRGHGYLRVHTFGGGTWVSEFAALTGMPHDIFGPGGAYAPFVLAPHVRDSLPRQLRRLGYTTVAIYPTHSNFLNGRDAYQGYGVDHLYGAEQLGLDDWEETDAQMFAAAKRVYDQVKKPGQPIFMMILTINQHGPHDDPMSTLPKPFQNLLHGLPADTALNFDTYLQRLHDSDTGMSQLERDFLHRDAPTLIVHFGDHQPSFNSLIRAIPRHLPPALTPVQDYITYFSIKTNFAAPALPSYPALDLAFLPGMVLQAAGLPGDAYFAASRQLRERCDGRYTDCPQTDLIKSYHAWIFKHLHVYQ